MNDTTTSEGYVTLIWEAHARPGLEAEMKAFLTRAISPSRNDPGNIEYEAHEVDGEPGAFLVLERWETRAALDRHLNAPRMTELVPRLLELMEGTIEDGVRFLTPFRPPR